MFRKMQGTFMNTLYRLYRIHDVKKCYVLRLSAQPMTTVYAAPGFHEPFSRQRQQNLR
jgi:hypothetical protein